MNSKIQAFKAKIFSNNENKKLVVFSGAINEEASLPNLSDFKDSPLFIDLEGVNFINSLGIRKWMRWLDSIEGFEIAFLRVPPVFIDQVNIVAGFLPEGGKVLSFFVPYVCEKCDSESLQLYSEGREFTNNKGAMEAVQVFCDDCKSGMDLSPVADRYFKFLGIELTR